MTLLKALSLTVVLGATTLVGSAAGAADPPPELERAKTACLAGIDERFTAIDRMQTAVAGSEHVTDAHASALDAELAATESGLTDLRVQIEAATTGAELRTLCPKVVTNYRVYLLEGATVHLTIGADTAVAASDRLDEIATKLEAAIADAQASGADVGDAPARLEEMRASIESARALTASVGDTVIPLTPADYNAGTAGPVLEGAKADVQSAKDSLKAAGESGRAIVEILKAL